MIPVPRKKKLVVRALQTYWRWSRGLTIGAQACVLDAQQRVLLVRHGYRPGWHFPGGGVEKNESIRTALERELDEEAGVRLDAEPELFAVYANFAFFPSDHVALFVVRRWSQPTVPGPNREILEQRFFDGDALPLDVNPPTGRRVREVLFGAERARDW